MLSVVKHIIHGKLNVYSRFLLQVYDSSGSSARRKADINVVILHQAYVPFCLLGI